MKKEDFIRKAREVHGDFYDYSLVTDHHKDDKVTIICPIHGAFEQRVNNHIYGRHHGCPKCGEIKKMERTRRHYIGDTFENEYGKYEIIGFKPVKRTIVKFIETGTIVETATCNVVKGRVKDFNRPTILGVGYLGYKKDPKQQITKNKAYIVWYNMLKRCYDEKSFVNHPTYKDCYVCKEWLCFKNFEKWYNANLIEDFYLDKDILFKGNKIYSPDTCCFVPNEINCLFTKRQNERGNLPIGVQYSESKKRYKASFTRGEDRAFLGYFDTPEEAFQAYKVAKEAWITEVANKWKGKIADNVYEAMMNYEVEITD